MKPTIPEQRKFLRYLTDAKVYFVLPYDFRTEVDYVIATESQDGSSIKHVGFSHDISVQGLSFESDKQLNTGDVLWMEVHMPKSGEIIYLQAMVRWSQLATPVLEQTVKYLTGVEVKIVDGVNVEQTIYFDKTYQVLWSELLERVLGGFAKANRPESSKKAGEPS